jgi:hypothetical protein
MPESITHGRKSIPKISVDGLSFLPTLQLSTMMTKAEDSQKKK